MNALFFLLVFDVNEKNHPLFCSFFLRSNQLVTPAEIRDRFSDIRFVRLSAIKYVVALSIGD